MSLLFLVVHACNKKLLIVQPQNWATLSYLMGDMTFLCCQGECKQVGNSLFSATVLPVASVADRTNDAVCTTARKTAQTTTVLMEAVFAGTTTFRE